LNLSGTSVGITGNTAITGTLSASTSITDSGLTANGVVTNTNTGVLGTLPGTTGLRRCLLNC
jgi:hypothetical protein